MDLADADQRATWCAYLGEIFADRKVICGLAPAAGFVDSVELLKSVGARKPLLVTTGPGAGPGPAADDAASVDMDAGRFDSMTEELRDKNRLARNLPGHVVRAVERYDPDRQAVWLVGPFISSDPIHDRPVVGGRPAPWLALEDKLVAEDIWRRIGAEHSPSRIVDVAQLPAAAANLDLGQGTVWSGDARDGFNGGGDFVRWVSTAQQQHDAVAFFAPRCDRVRVMSFLDGVPCSIHGIVLPDGTAAFRPVELAILRGSSRRFVYGGQGTYWDPPAEDREAMRELVRRTGEHLRARVDYRGAFGIDGIMTVDGFRPTELNTRMSGGLTTLARAFDATPMNLLQFSCTVGRDPKVTVAELEAWALVAMDEHRISKAMAISERRTVEQPVTLTVAFDGTSLVRAESGLSLVVGPTAVGTFAKIIGDTLGPGERVAPLNAALLRFLDEELGTCFGAVEVAPDVRAH